MFASIPQSDLLEMNSALTAKEFQLYAVFKMECFEGGGVCRLNLKEICEKYGFKSYDNLTRIHKSLKAKEWIIETKAGETCRKLATEKNSVDELRKTQSESKETEKNSAEEKDELSFSQSDEEKELRKTQLPTEKNSGTGVALNKDLDFKDNLNQERENARALAPDFAFLLALDEIEIHRHFFPDYTLTLGDKKTIRQRIRDKTAWIRALFYWSENNYRAESIGKQCTKHDEILEEKASKNGATSYKTGKKNDEHRNGSSNGSAEIDRIRGRIKKRA